MLKVILLGIVEGITEWLPISSTGHMILVDEFIKLNVPKDFMEMFLVVIQLGGRIIAVGTTSTRTLESVADENGIIHPGCGNTEIFIYPGYKFKAIDCLITNFHLPESTLLMLVSALAGKEHIMAAYKEAVKERYRFFSFGDAMFIQ